MKRILSIDGGGIRGILPATLLAAVEQRDGRPLAQTYDLIAGTSTGGIIACALASGLSAAQTVALYRDHGAEIFPKSFARKLSTGFGAFRAKYSPAPLEQRLKILGTRSLASVGPCQLLVPTYCVKLPEPESIDGGESTQCASALLFKSWQARALQTKNFFLTDVARATSAAPTYFPAAKIMNMYAQQFTCIDGGVFANNPVLCAVAAAHDLWPGEKLKVHSLGTGSKVQATPAGDWGAVQWVSRVSDVLMDGVEDTATYIARDVLKGNFVRCQTGIVGPSEAMDDASPANIAALEKLGAVWVAKFLDKL